MHFQRNIFEVNKLFQVCSIDFKAENNMVIDT